MYLEKIEIQGFKSFAHKTVLEFTNGITAIVGPNGSGKSNVADAIKWVLGEQSLKNIRGKKSEDVIFAGSKEKAKMGMAEVSLYLNNDDSQMPIDFPEVVITRRLYRNGDSEYLINKNTARLMDIQDLLLKSGFGQKTYSVISQGQIGSILGATPQARKEMFDEAAGVKQFQIKRDSALRKLGKTKQNLLRITDLLRELNPRLRSLKNQAEKAQKGEVLERELREMQTKLFAHLWDKYTTRLRESEEAFSKKQDKIDSIEDEISKISQKIEDEEKRTSSSQLESQKLQNNLENAREKRSNIQQELALTKGKIDLAKEKTTGIDVAGLNKEKKIKEEQAGDLEAKNKTLDIEISGQEKELSTLQNKLKEFNLEVVSIQQGIQKIQVEKNTSPKENGEFELQISALEKEMGDFANDLMACSSLAELEELKNRGSEISKKLESVLAKYKKINGQHEPEQKDVARLQAKLNEITNKREEISNRLNTLKVAIATNQAAKDAHDRQISFLRVDLKSLEEKLKAGEKTDSGRSHEHEQLLQKEKELSKELEKIEVEFSNHKQALDEFNNKDLDAKKSVFELERNYRSKQNELNELRLTQNNIQIEKTKHQTRREDIDREMQEDLGEKSAEIKKLAEHHKHRSLGKEQERVLHQKIDKHKRQLDVIGGIDSTVIDEHKQLNKRVEFLNTQSNDLKDAADKLRKIIEELDTKIKKEFEKSFQAINLHFSKYFKVLFGGGEAKLSLVRQVKETKDDEDNVKKEIVESIEIKAVPPGKKMKSLGMLSGGEKTMTSLALLMAIISNNPSPFIVMDEVDAALDEANSRRYARILSRLIDNTQFIVVTHNRETMRQAGILYGVTMERNGVSKILSVKLEKAEEIAQ